MTYVNFEKNGLTKSVKLGFSWTTFFFGMFVPLARGMWLHFLVCLCTFNMASLVYMFAINRLYARALIESGWKIQGLWFPTAWK